MKYTALSLVVLASVAASHVAVADSQTFTLGYAQSKVTDFKNINGVNLKYRYEWNSPLSVISSFTYLSGSKSDNQRDGLDAFDGKADVKYYSLSAGPAYRFNEFVSVYGLIGFNNSKATYDNKWGWYGASGNYQQEYRNVGNNRSTNFLYGVGLQINPWENVAIDVGYEGSKINDGYKNFSVNGFNVGVGYRF